VPMLPARRRPLSSAYQTTWIWGELPSSPVARLALGTREPLPSQPPAAGNGTPPLGRIGCVLPPNQSTGRAPCRQESLPPQPASPPATRPMRRGRQISHSWLLLRLRPHALRREIFEGPASAWIPEEGRRAPPAMPASRARICLLGKDRMELGGVRTTENLGAPRLHVGEIDGSKSESTTLSGQGAAKTTADGRCRPLSS